MRLALCISRPRVAPLAVAALLLAHGSALRGQERYAMREPAPELGISSSAEPSAAASAAVPADSAGAALLQTRTSQPHSFWTGLGFDSHVGINGFGGNIAMPLALHFNLRVGGDYFGYKTSFTEQGANVTAALHLGHAKTALDWYPFHNGFRVSPQMMFAVQTHVAATVLVPSGSTITLDGSDYVSSNTDPLHGNASVGTRKVAPGLTVGWGNTAPREGRHLTFPVEMGFYYIGQPSLQVSFTGSACEPNTPQPLGCQSVTNDPGFQHDLAAFIRRNQNNLSYASFFPEASVGVGYRF